MTFSTEQLENLIAMLKRFSVVKNTGKEDSYWQLCKCADLYCLGTVIHDQIDFLKILKHLKKQKQLFYDEIKTPQLFKHCKEKMPLIVKKMVEGVENMQVGDELIPIIKRIYDHGDVSLREMNQAEEEAFENGNDFINDAFYLEE